MASKATDTNHQELDLCKHYQIANQQPSAGFSARWNSHHHIFNGALHNSRSSSFAVVEANLFSQPKMGS
jgi:hypothetical protein